MKVYEASQRVVYKQITEIDSTGDTKILASPNGEYGLINRRTGEIIFDYSKEEIEVHPNKWYYWQLQRNKDGKTYIRLYDPYVEKMLIDNMIFIDQVFNYEYMILQDPITQIYYFFNPSNYEKLPEFDLSVDNIKKLCIGNNSWCYLMSFTKNGKKALYSIERYQNELKTITDYEYDNIEENSSILIFTKDGHKSFIHKSKISDMTKCKQDYSEIICQDYSSSMQFTVICCKREDSLWDLYYIDNYSTDSRLIDTISCDSISCESFLGRRNGNYGFIFKIEKDSKYGIIFKQYDYNCREQEPYKVLIDIEYDNIEILFQNDKKIAFLLTKDNKKSIYTYDKEYDKLNRYDNIKELKRICFGDIEEFYGIKTDGKWQIIDLLEDEIILDGINILQEPHDTSYSFGSLIFEEDNKIGFLGLIPKDEDGNKYSCIYGYDDYKELGNGYYIVRKNNKYGIVRDNKKVIEPEYESIEIYDCNGQKNPDLNTDDLLYFSLKAEKGYIIKGYNPMNDSMWQLNNREEFTNYRFYKEIIATKDEERTNIFCYGSLENGIAPVSKSFSKDVIIQPVSVVDNDGKRKEVYLIDGKYYCNNYGTFEITTCALEPVYLDWIDEYNEAYVFVVASSPEELNEKSRIIRESKPEEVRKTLVKLNERYKRN